MPILWVCKRKQLTHLGHRKPSFIHWKADTPKTSHSVCCEFRSRGIIDTVFFENAQIMAVKVCSEKLKRRILATFRLNRTALHATHLKLYSIFWALFLKIALSVAELMSFDHLRAAIRHCWAIICKVAVKDKYYADKPDTL